jgi:hypothetical protein
VTEYHAARASPSRSIFRPGRRRGYAERFRSQDELQADRLGLRRACRCLHLDEFELHAVRSLEKHTRRPPGYDGLLEDVDASVRELLDQRIELVGIDGDVLYAVLLLAVCSVRKSEIFMCRP